MWSIQFMTQTVRDYRIIVNFKTFLKDRHCSEYLTAFVWLHTILDIVELPHRSAEMQRFWTAFLSPTSERCIETDVQVGESYDPALAERDILQSLLDEIASALLPHWNEFYKTQPEPRTTEGRSPRKSKRAATRPQLVHNTFPRTASDELVMRFAKPKDQ